MKTTSLPQTIHIYRFEIIEWTVVLLAFLSGILHPSPKHFYTALPVIFLSLSAAIMGLSYLLYTISQHNGERIQGKRRKAAPIFTEAAESVRSMFVAACLSAWPVGLYQAGLPTGYAWTLQEMGLTWWMVILQMWGGIIAVDAYSYWKHRLLHTKPFFPFHRKHHTFHDPTPFAGFAVGPVESVLTYWPLLLICYPLPSILCRYTLLPLLALWYLTCTYTVALPLLGPKR